MVGRSIVRIDQQGNVQLGFGVFISVSHRVFSLCLSGVHVATGSERNRSLDALVPVWGRDEFQENVVMKRLVLASAIASSIAVSGCATDPYGYNNNPQAQRAVQGAALGGLVGAATGAVVGG